MFSDPVFQTARVCVLVVFVERRDAGFIELVRHFSEIGILAITENDENEDFSNH